VQALEQWASREAATILVGIFLVAAVVMAVAVIPTLALERGRVGDTEAELPGAPGALPGAPGAVPDGAHEATPEGEDAPDATSIAL